MGFSERSGNDAPIATAGRRSLRAHRPARGDGPGRDGRARLGRSDLARMGSAAPNPARRRRPHEHRGAPTAGFARAGLDPAGPAPGCAATRVRADAGVHPDDARAVAAALAQADSRRVSRAVPVGRRGASASARSCRTFRSIRRTRARRRSTRSSPTSERSATCPPCCCGGRRIRCSPTSTSAISKTRFPAADVHRFVGASHLVSEDADVAGVIHEWVAQLPRRHSADAVADASTVAVGRRGEPAWSSLDRRTGDTDVAMIEMTAGGVGRSITFAALDADVRRTAAGLVAHGVRHGDRVALLIPPGIDLTVCLYACWRMGAVVVVVDAGLGARGISRALKSATPKFLIGIPRALAAARALGWPGERISAVTLQRRRCARARCHDLARRRSATRGDRPNPFRRLRPIPTSPRSSSPRVRPGPAKGVVYRHHQLQAQRDVLARVYDITADDRFVAAFAPFALYGPAMGVPSVVPDMSVTAPGTLARGRARRGRRSDRRDARVRIARRVAQRDRDRGRSHATPPRRARQGADASCRPARRCRARCCARSPRSCRTPKPHTPVRHDRGAAGLRHHAGRDRSRGRGQRRVRRASRCPRCRSRSARSTISARPPESSRRAPASRVRCASRPRT